MNKAMMTDKEVIDILCDCFNKDHKVVTIYNGKTDETTHLTIADICNVISHLKAENERLQTEKDNLIKTYSECQKENLKEFVKRLKSQKHICLPPIGCFVDENDWVIYEYDIDETYKEMVGEDNA